MKCTCLSCCGERCDFVVTFFQSTGKCDKIKTHHLTGEKNVMTSRNVVADSKGNLPKLTNSLRLKQCLHTGSGLQRVIESAQATRYNQTFYHLMIDFHDSNFITMQKKQQLLYTVS